MRGGWGRVKGWEDTEIDGKTIIKLGHLSIHTFHITYFLTCLFKCTTHMRPETECLCAKMDMKTCGMAWWFICSSCSVKCDTIYLADAACPQTDFFFRHTSFSFYLLNLKGSGTCAETCRSESNRVNTTQRNDGEQFGLLRLRRERRVYPICIITGDTNKTNSTGALLRQGVVCLNVNSVFSANVYLWSCIVLSMRACLEARVWANVYSLWLC